MEHVNAETWAASQKMETSKMETSKFGSNRLVVSHNGSDEIFIEAADGQRLRISFDSRRFFQVTGKSGLIVTPGKVGGKIGIMIKDANFYQIDPEQAKTAQAKTAPKYSRCSECGCADSSSGKQYHYDGCSKKYRGS